MHQRHLLILASWYPSKSNPSNGDFVQRIALASKQFAKITVLHFTYTNDKKHSTKLEINKHNGIEEWIYYQKKSRFKVRNQWVFFFQSIALLKQIQKHKGKVNSCNVQVIWRMGIIGLLYKLLFNIPYTITEHWTGYMEEDYQLQSKSMLFLSRYCAKKAEKVIAVSNPLASTLAQVLHIPEIVVLENIVHTVDLDRPEEAHDHQFLHVSNFRDEQKNISGIIHAFGKAYQQNNRIHLILVGSNNKAFVHTLTKAAGLPIEAFTLKGTLNHNETIMQIALADTLICFSNFETFALTCAESICVGTPVIYTACGGPESYIQPFMGIEVTKGNIHSLTEAILHISANPSLFDRSKIKQEARKQFNMSDWVTKAKDTM